MLDQKTRQKLDTKEFELPETVCTRTIEDRVFQSLVLRSLSKISGIGLVEGNFIDSLLGRDSVEGVKGITIEQENKNHSVAIKIEVSIAYGISIPDKAEEIQSKIAEDITKFSGLHVSSVHVTFKNIMASDQFKKGEQAAFSSYAPASNAKENQERYTDEF